MTIEIRPITDEEYLPLSRVLGTAFGGVDDEDAELQRSFFELDRSLAALDGDEIVGAAGAYSFDLTLPGATTTPVAGVTWVGVLPSHRRQGILRSLMARQLDDVAERGEALAILTASESIIYGRFGYGWASTVLGVEIDPRHSAFLPQFERRGRVRVVDAAAAGKVVPELYDRWRQGLPGAVTRRPEWWEVWLKDPKKWRRGGESRFYAVHESEPGQADGYLTWRTKPNWQNGVSATELMRGDLVALSDAAHSDLWRFCLDIDLVGKVQAAIPPDDPLRWHMADPRRLRVTGCYDMLWARLLDVPAALEARRYQREDRLVLEVDDGFRPQTSGRYEVEGGPDGANCRRTDAGPDLSMGIVELGCAYLGGVAPTELARAGRVQEHTPGALARADAMFASTPAPYCNTGF